MGYIVVVGGLNIDIIGTPHREPLPGDSSPGVVKVSVGGVGRNIARSLRRLGDQVELIAPVAKGADGEFARLDCERLGIGLSAALEADASCRYLCVNGPDGDLRLAVNDMAAMERLTPEEIEARLSLINGGVLVALDANLPEDAIGYLSRRAEVPLVADPVSAPKAGRLKRVLSLLTAIKPNRAEAAALTGLAPESAPEALAAALIRQGVGHVYLSLGGEGLLYMGPKGAFTIPGEASGAVSFNGCGDAATAAVAHGLAAGLTPLETARLAMRAAAEQAREV